MMFRHAANTAVRNTLCNDARDTSWRCAQ